MAEDSRSQAEPVRRLSKPSIQPSTGDPLHSQEWLVTNGLGGYASGRVSGFIMRRYHGLLVAALPSPLGRVVMLNHLTEYLVLPDGRFLQFSDVEGFSPEQHEQIDYLSEFRLENGLPVWSYQAEGVQLEKRLILPYRQNTVHITYTLLEGPEAVRLDLRPAVHFRRHEASVSTPLKKPYSLTILGSQYEISSDDEFPTLRILFYGAGTAFSVDATTIEEILYRVEESRGYEARGTLWSPGCFSLKLFKGQSATLVASTESWEAIFALSPQEALASEQERRRRLLITAFPDTREGPAAELVLAADQFIIAPAGRVPDAVRARAAGRESRTVIAGYHWFTDWGRDTMISLEGLNLITGRRFEARWILRAFAYYVRDGLIPNMFPEGANEGLYNTADATLWFFHAISRYSVYANDNAIISLLLPTLLHITDQHINGTRFNIRVDPRDGLLRQGEAGYQLTWMDAKVDDWVVTPRRGKTVEINALWYNALRLMQRWVGQERGPDEARPFQEAADRVYQSFNEHFWYEKGGYLYDVIDGEQGKDEACRPNQLFAISLEHPVLREDRWGSVLEVVRNRLLTPVGLRTLAPGHRDYKPKYYGDIRSRDAAYHQGTVWPWLLGPFIDAWLKVHPGEYGPGRRFLEGILPHLGDKCIGSISEIFDGDPPFLPHGCISQAWSVAEVLRAWVKTSGPDALP